jgi:hypothetical protein
MSMTLNEIWPGPKSLLGTACDERLGKAEGLGSEQDWPWDWTGSCPSNEGRRHLPTAANTFARRSTLVFRLLRIPTFIPLVNTIVSLAPLPQSPKSATPPTHTHIYRPTCPPASSKWADQAALALRSSSLSSWVCLISLPTHSDSIC